MGTLTIDLHSDESTFHVTFQHVAARKSFLQSYLLADAITSLIGAANTDGWSTLSNELRPDEYYDAILTAIAHQYEHCTDACNLEPYEALKMLIEHLHERGLLRKKAMEEHLESFYDEL